MKVRVECGPHDARKNSCVLAFSKKAGDVAERQSCQVCVTYPRPDCCIQFNAEQCLLWKPLNDMRMLLDLEQVEK